jgi:hypothetical protein
MPERPDLRQIAASLRESLDGLEREALVELLTYVLNEYVVEGPPPLGALEVEKLEELAGLSLAGLIGSLQTRLDTPGLDLLRVEGEEVRVHTATGWVPLQAVRAAPAAEARPEPAVEGRAGARFVEQPMTARPAPRPPSPPAPEPPTGRAAADEALQRGRGDLIGGERGVVTPPPPRPRGLSISGRPTTASTQPPPAAQPPQTQPPPAPEPQQPSTERKEDDAAIRFSLLELD